MFCLTRGRVSFHRNSFNYLLFYPVLLCPVSSCPAQQLNVYVLVHLCTRLARCLVDVDADVIWVGNPVAYRFVIGGCKICRPFRRCAHAINASIYKFAGRQAPV